MTDYQTDDRRYDAPLPATRPEVEATGDHGPRGADIDALVADSRDGTATGDPLMEDPRPKE